MVGGTGGVGPGPERSPNGRPRTRAAATTNEDEGDVVRRQLHTTRGHLQRHPRLSAVTALVAATAVLVVLAHGVGAPAPAAASATTPPAAGSASPGPAPHRSPTVRGQLTALVGDTWTVSPTTGTTITVAVGAQTTFGTAKTPLGRDRFTVGTQVAVIGSLTGDTVTARRIILAPATAAPTEPAPTTSAPTSTPAPTTPAPSPPVPASTNTCAITAEARQAVAYASSRGERAAIAVADTATGAYSAAGDADAPYSSASVVKILIATDLLLTGQMSGATATTAHQMVVASDDDAADTLYGLVGGDAVLTTVAAHYAIPDLGSPPADTGQWGETQLTADGLVHLYAKLKADPQVWPWLANAMANTTRDGTDGTDQFFGIPSAATNWAVKQGWMTGLGPGSTYNSTGYVGGDRYAVVILTYGSVAQYGPYMATTITEMAKDILPGGAPGAATTGCPA